MKKFQRSALITVTLGSTFLFAACSYLNGGSGVEAPPLVPKETGCPVTPEAMGRLDWGLDSAVTLEVRNGLIASSQAVALVRLLEQDLVGPCTGLAEMLGVDPKALLSEAKELGAKAEHVCKVAADAVTRLRAKAGGSLVVELSPRDCSTRQGVADECMAACGATATPECEGELAGKCEERCDGLCEYAPGSDCRGACEGTCSGACESQFEGTCSGTCSGKCEGRTVEGVCQGKCRGKCDKGAKGSCLGTCLGTCDSLCSLEASGICEGVCAGECSSSLKGAVCRGSLLVPLSEGSCEMGCDALVMSELKCARQNVSVKVKSAANKIAALSLEEALTKYVPEVVVARYQVLNYERVARMATHAKGAVAAMNKAMKASELKPSSMAKSCVKSASDALAPVEMALPSISLAGDGIVEATTGE